MTEQIRSAVAVLEAPDCFVLHRRPDLPGRLAYSGKVHLLGGGVNPGESLQAAVLREIGEETNFQPTQATLLWEGDFTGEDKKRHLVTRYVGLFVVNIIDLSSLRLQKKEGGELVKIEKTLEAIAKSDLDFTPFAQKALTMLVTGQNQFEGRK